ETQIRPQLDGGEIEYVGEVNLAEKGQLFAGARALLFPIEWEEPFGLVMIEAMACGAPVLAFARGAAPEVVADGVSGWLCRDVDEMAARARQPGLPPLRCRLHVERRFSLERMVAGYLEVYAACIRRHTAAAAEFPRAGASPLQAAS
ncbi:MAG: glycosyltransferase, partial [Terriglobales bacterium]